MSEITGKEQTIKINIPIIESNNPRHDFYRVIMEYFAENRFDSGIHETAVIEPAEAALTINVELATPINSDLSFIIFYLPLLLNSFYLHN